MAASWARGLAEAITVRARQFQLLRPKTKGLRSTWPAATTQCFGWLYKQSPSASVFDPGGPAHEATHQRFCTSAAAPIGRSKARPLSASRPVLTDRQAAASGTGRQSAISGRRWTFLLSSRRSSPSWKSRETLLGRASNVVIHHSVGCKQAHLIGPSPPNSRPSSPSSDGGLRFAISPSPNQTKQATHSRVPHVSPWSPRRRGVGSRASPPISPHHSRSPPRLTTPRHQLRLPRRAATAACRRSPRSGGPRRTSRGSPSSTSSTRRQLARALPRCNLNSRSFPRHPFSDSLSSASSAYCNMIRLCCLPNSNP
jgi:hypothetical protein